MPSCLGLYIEDNLIKYAKVSKNNEALKVESLGIKFYEKLGTAIRQIVEETYSFKNPISINSTDEWYNEIQVFSLLSKKDIKNAIDMEFENICYTKDLNENIYEKRYILTNSHEGNDKVRAIHISVPQTSLEQRKKQFSEYKVSNISPLSASISNLLRRDKRETCLVVNIEKETIVTKIKNGDVLDIYPIEYGSQEILENISRKENSISKAYEICKSATIYTETDKDLQYEENEYLADIMPTLFKIATEVRNITKESMENIERVYITGTGANVNNIDIYFQEYLNDIPCEILKPAFLMENSKINIKDYIEVNSAIAIAIQGLDKNNDINFKTESKSEKMQILFSDINTSELMQSADAFLSRFRRQFGSLSMLITMMVFIYAFGTVIINEQMKLKMAETEETIASTNKEIETVEKYDENFKSQTSSYERLISNIQSLNNTNSEDKRYRNTIPNLLNNIMTVIPKGVQLESIHNTTDTHIVIVAKSSSYEETAYFKAKLKTEGILENVVSDTGTITNNYLKVTIEGELP